MANVIIQFPDFTSWNPLPPASAAFMPELLPIVIPNWYPSWRIQAIGRGWLPRPQVDRVAELRKRMDTSPLRRKGRIGLVAYADTAAGELGRVA